MNCVICGTKLGFDNKGPTCSPCWEGLSDRDRDKYSGKTEKVCAHCGETYYVHYKGKVKAKYCSIKCRELAEKK